MLNISLLTLALFPLPKISKTWWHHICATLMLMTYINISKTLQFQSLISLSPTSNMDPLSAALASLTIWISCLMFLASYKIMHNNNNSKMFAWCVLSLMLVLILCFSTSNILHFYIWFEASLIPTILLIVLWGYQPERIQASIYLMIYTVTASLPLLLSILLIFNTWDHLLLSHPLTSTPITLNPHLLSTITILAFLVKLPLFLVHLWLPKAHVEAPVAGSMILAAILLKLGGYGLLRFTLNMPKLMGPAGPLLMSIATIGGIATSLICLRQTDLKSIIAYSSIGHMGLMCAGAASNFTLGFNASLIMMAAHGFSSSALFCLANISYESTHSRSLSLTKGMLVLTPIMSLWWFLSICANMAAPPTINLLSEILLISSSISFSFILIIPLMLMSFLSVCYSLHIYSSVNHGHPLSITNPQPSPGPNHNLLMLLHLAPVFLLILNPAVISNWL